MSLQYKTRGMSDPQGKPRVYFCCHPKDFVPCFGPISDELLKKQNCAIWYDDSGNAAWDKEREMELGQMQLFVMPVTTKLLTTPNRALGVEFPFAVKHHIPVLPLMQEGDLEELFNKKCGDLQFLDKTAQDSTAISYEEKLEKYLSSVLIGDELAEKVRGAFDAYIFLSYRKKDRKYAQELMRLIHKNDFCRDIAIWYDEFLTPGENFNHAIKAALQKSDFFTLVVTPNLVNETNYVITTEYPEAKKCGKEIFPAQMVPTDEGQLKDKFEAIPKCVDAHEEDELTASLLDTLGRLAINPTESSPQHNFFIGLAYLSGIDVEVDRDRALKLITDAAESGLPEAIKKLVDMYRSGSGVERNYRTAIHWQQCYVEINENVYAAEMDKRNWENLARSLWDLGDFYYDLQNLQQAKSAFLRINELCSTNPYAPNSIEVFQMYAISCRKLGAIFHDEGDYEQAANYHSEALNAYNKIKGENDSIEIERGLYLTHLEIGRLYDEIGNFANSRIQYRVSLHICLNVAKKTQSDFDYHNMCVSAVSYGRVCEKAGDTSVAKQCYELCQSICLKLYAVTCSLDTLSLLARSCSDLGAVYEKVERDFDKAIDCYKNALDYDLQLMEKRGLVVDTINIACDYHNLGMMYAETFHHKSARECYQKALDIHRNLVAKVNTLRERKNLASSCEELGDWYYDIGAFSKAKKLYQEALDIRRKLYDEVPENVEFIIDLANALDRIGDILVQEENYEEAEEDYRQALELCLGAYEHSGSLDILSRVYCGYGLMGDLEKKRKNFSMAKEYYSKALTVSRQLINKADTDESRDRLGDAYYFLATVDLSCIDCGMLHMTYNILEGLINNHPENIHYIQKMGQVKALLEKYERT